MLGGRANATARSGAVAASRSVTRTSCRASSLNSASPSCSVFAKLDHILSYGCGRSGRVSRRVQRSSRLEVQPIPLRFDYQVVK